MYLCMYVDFYHLLLDASSRVNKRNLFYTNIRNFTNQFIFLVGKVDFSVSLQASDSKILSNMPCFDEANRGVSEEG